MVWREKNTMEIWVEKIWGEGADLDHNQGQDGEAGALGARSQPREDGQQQGEHICVEGSHPTPGWHGAGRGITVVDTFIGLSSAFHPPFQIHGATCKTSVMYMRLSSDKAPKLTEGKGRSQPLVSQPASLFCPLKVPALPPPHLVS